MKTLSDILRAADPLNDEPRPTADARQRTRDAVLRAAHRAPAVRPTPRRTLVGAVIAAVAVVVLAGAAWRHISVDAVAAVEFEARLAATGQHIASNRDILSARVVAGTKPATYWVAITFTADGADKMRRATEAHIGEQLELLIDGKVVMAPIIRSAISSAATISGDYTRAEATRIVDGLLKDKVELRGR